MVPCPLERPDLLELRVTGWDRRHHSQGLETVQKSGQWLPAQNIPRAGGPTRRYGTISLWDLNFSLLLPLHYALMATRASLLLPNSEGHAHSSPTQAWSLCQGFSSPGAVWRDPAQPRASAQGSPHRGQSPSLTTRLKQVNPLHLVLSVFHGT